MAVQINTYTGCQAAMLAWMARETDTRLSDRFDDFLLNCERRMYYGYATENPSDPLHSEPLRIVEMEAAAQGVISEGTVAQPNDFVELISALNSGDGGPIEQVAQRTIDGYGNQALGRTAGLIAVSGQNFRFLDVPSGVTVTLRYYKKLTTPSAAAGNDILTNYPDVYLYGTLIEAAIFTQDEVAAQRYLQLYNSSVSGLNSRTQRITASSVPRMRVRAGMTP